MAPLFVQLNHKQLTVLLSKESELVLLPAQYEEGSAPALALKATMERTEKRFKNYGDAGLLCGTDGLPHLISDPGLALRYGHSGETLVRPLATLCL